MSDRESVIMKKWMSCLLGAIAVPLISGCFLSCKNEEPQVNEPVRPLPLGPSELAETRGNREVTPGVTYTRIERGAQSSQDVFTVDVAFKADRATAESLVADLKAKGFEARLETVSKRAPDDPGSGPIGYLVRSGSVSTTNEVNTLRDRLAA